MSDRYRTSWTNKTLPLERLYVKKYECFKRVCNVSKKEHMFLPGSACQRLRSSVWVPLLEQPAWPWGHPPIRGRDMEAKRSRGCKWLWYYSQGSRSGWMNCNYFEHTVVASHYNADCTRLQYKIKYKIQNKTLCNKTFLYSLYPCLHWL